MKTIQDEIKELKAKLAKLEKQAEQKKIKGRHNPGYKQEYFYVSNDGYIIEDINNQFYMDDYRMQIGNCFESREEAEKHKRILVLNQKLKDLAAELNNGQEIDWNNSGQAKYYLKYGENQVYGDTEYTEKSQGTIYCLDYKFISTAKEKIGEDNLKELILGE